MKHRMKKNLCIFLLILLHLLSCTSNSAIKTIRVKNITDYYNILSDQKIVMGKIIKENGKYIIQMKDCYEAYDEKIDIVKNTIFYIYTNPCAGPPPDYFVMMAMSVSDDKTVFMYVCRMDRITLDKESDFYKFNGVEFVKIKKKNLPAEVSAMFRTYD